MIPVYAFDTSALVRFLKGEIGHARVLSILDDARAGRCEIVISAINWGELQYTVNEKLVGLSAPSLSALFATHGLNVIPATKARAERAGWIKLNHKIGYADCYGIELAMDSPGHTLITADFGVKPAAHLANIEFLPPLPTRQ